MIKRMLAVMMAFVMIFSCMPVLNAHAAEITPTATGTTYYVSSNHGAEGNDGTSESAPFASLLEINDITLQPGDRVLLERGSVFVDEYLHIKGSGSKEAPIIIDVYGEESQPKPLIQTNGNGVWYQDYGKSLDNANHVRQGSVSSCILLYDVEYIEISNIAMTNEGNFANGEVYNSAYRMDRTGVAGVAENIGTVDHIVLKNLDIRNVQGNVYNKHMCNGGIYFVCHLPDNESATGISKFDDVLIEGCRLDEVNRWGIAVGYTAYWDRIPYGQTIDPEVCSTYGSTNVVIRNNYLTNIGGDGITTMYCSVPLIEYNVLDGYCQDITDETYVHEGSRGGQVAAGIWPWMCKSPVFQYNECYSSTYNQDGQAWDADWGDNAIYQYNYSCNNAGGAVMFCGQWACNTVFRYNISQNDLDGVLNLAGSPNGEIYNNVFYIKEGVKINRDGMSGGRGNTITNNIFYYTGSTPADATLGNWGDISAEWRNNIYYNYTTTPDDAYAITADPMFVDPGKGPTGAQASGLVHDLSVFDGYKLKPESPAIDAGMPIENNGGLDFFGNELDLLPDIGAYDAGTCDADASKAVVVNVDLGESITLTDLSGDYSGTTPTVDDEKIASVILTSKGSISQSTVSSTAATSLKDGADYMICNVNTGSALTNVMVDAPAWGTRALQLSSDKTVSDSNTWTLEASGSSYKWRSADGSYLSIALNASSLGEGDVFTAATSGSSDVWTFCNPDGYYLDNLGRMDFLGGWTEVGNSSTWKLYEIINTVLDGATELTFTGLYPGTANIIVGDTLYLVRVSGKLQEAQLEVGETATFTDESGNYTDADTSALDTNVATVELSGMLTNEYTLGSKVTTLTSGGKYILVNTRAGKPVTNASATHASATGLSLSGEAKDAEKAAIWTITGSNGSYTIQDLDSKYMTVGSDTAGLSADPATLSLKYSGTWTISGNGAYLNHFGGSGSTCAAGWLDDAASYDSGSQWDIYEVTTSTAENGTQIVFTAVGSGETHVLIGSTMYHIVVTGTGTTPPSGHHFENGFCDHCDEYQPAELKDGVYEIGNAGQLYWFRAHVMGGNLDADTILTADITVNEDVLVEGELNEDAELRTWYGIGSNAKKYTGTFDGQGHTISGLYYNNDSTNGSYRGLFGAIGPGAVIKNVLVADGYIYGSGEVGGIVGQNFGGTVDNCHNTSCYVGGAGSNIGGIVGQNFGTVIGCSNSGTVYGEGRSIGGVVGLNTSDGTDAAAKNATVSQCFNVGTVTRDNDNSEAAIGGVVGENNDSTVINCYNAGSVSNKGIISGGVVGKADRGTIENCHNVGSVSGKQDVGGVIGKIYNSPTVTNCYYLADAETDELDGTTAKSETVFASGEVAYLLNGSKSDASVVWKQILRSDDYPSFEGPVVHYDSENETYYNDGCAHTPGEAVKENEVPATCTEDGSYVSVLYCSKCGEEISRGETVVVPALGHDWKGTSCQREGCDATRVNPFKDVLEGTYYIDPVLWAVQEGITDGMTDTTFVPDGVCTRNQVVTFLWRAAGKPEPAADTVNPFTDVKESDYFYEAVLWAYENKITDGMTDTTFVPNGECTRAQVVTFLWRANDKPESTVESTFDDVKPDQYYTDAVAWAFENGITDGIDDYNFGVEDTCTRAQVVTFLYRNSKVN